MQGTAEILAAINSNLCRFGTYQGIRTSNHATAKQWGTP
jgi:hypothetical protein